MLIRITIACLAFILGAVSCNQAQLQKVNAATDKVCDERAKIKAIERILDAGVE